MKCSKCGKQYPTESAFIADCTVGNDGWTWGYFHKCGVAEPDVCSRCGVVELVEDSPFYHCESCRRK